MQDRCSEFTEILVTAFVDGDKIVLTPNNDFSREQLEAILEAGEDRRQWNSMDSYYDYICGNNVAIGASFACGGRQYEIGLSSRIFTDYRGSVKIYLNLTTESSCKMAAYAVIGISRSSGGMGVIEGSTADRVVLKPMAKRTTSA